MDGATNGAVLVDDGVGEERGGDQPGGFAFALGEENDSVIEEGEGGGTEEVRQENGEDVRDLAAGEDEEGAGNAEEEGDGYGADAADGGVDTAHPEEDGGKDDGEKALAAEEGPGVKPVQ